MTQKQQQGQDYSKMLIWASALVGVVRYSAAFLASDMGEITGNLSTIISALLGLSGLGMGFLDTVGGAYLFDGWRKAMPKNGQAWPFRFRVLSIFVFLIFATGLGILVPFTVSRVAHETMALTLGPTGIWLWGLAVNLAPILLIGGVATGQHVVKVAEDGGQMTGQMTDPGGQKTGQKTAPDGQIYPSDWRKIRKLLTDDQVKELTKLRTEQICYKYGVTDRQARRWREKASEEVTVRAQA